MSPKRGWPVELPTSLAASRNGEAAILTLSRPEKRNALNGETVVGIETFFRALPDDIKAVVIHGEGDNFSAGLDLSELRDTDVGQALAHSRLWHRVASHPAAPDKIVDDQHDVGALDRQCPRQRALDDARVICDE